jgi:hypothetical protein
MYFVEGVNCEKSLWEIVSNFTQLRKVQTHKLQYLVHLYYTYVFYLDSRTRPGPVQVKKSQNRIRIHNKSTLFAMIVIEHFE